MTEWRGWALEPGRQGEVLRVGMWRAMGECYLRRWG